MKLKEKILALFLGAVMTFSCTACTSGGEKKKMSFVKTDGKYALEISNNGETYRTAAGAFGVRVSYDEISDVSETEYVNYDTFEKIDGGYLAKAQLKTEDGSEFAATDFISENNGKIEVVRDIEVLKKGEAKGFMTYFTVRDNRAGKAEERKWFAPSAYYGNGEATFLSSGVKFGFGEDVSVAPADNLGAPVIMNYHNGSALAVTDLTGGRRETVVEDYSAKESSVIVDEYLNIPGIGLANVQKGDKTYVEMFHCYPANTFNYINCYPFANIYRMLPVTEGLTRQTAFKMELTKESDFDKAVENTWNKAYNDYRYVDSRYSGKEIYTTLLDNVYKSFGYIGGIPQFMTNTDHPYADSGFLYRNTDLSYILISAGYRLNRQDYIDCGIEVIDYHVKEDYIDSNARDNIERGKCEGLMAVEKAYAMLKTKGVNKTKWLAYLLGKGEAKLKVNDPMTVPFLLSMHNLTTDKVYLDRSIELMDAQSEMHNEYYYKGALVNPAGDAITDRESSMIFLGVYVDLYKKTNDKKWLIQAERAAIYFESTHIVQNIDLFSKGTTGYETFNDEGRNRYREMGMTGNGKVSSYGLSFVSSQTASADIAGAYASPALYDLGSLTGKNHYKDFSDFLLHNTALTINMGDKHSLMDDIRHSAGMGFMNEYIGVGASTDSVSAGRGTMHMSNLGWNMFVILSAFDSMYGVNPDFALGETREAFNVATFKYAAASSEKSGIYRAYNAVDNNADSMWQPKTDDAAKSLTVDIGEFAAVKNISVTKQNVESIKIEYSADNVNFTLSESTAETSTKVFTARYVKISLINSKEGGGLKDIKITANPIVNQNLALNADITADKNDGNAKKMADWKYNTAYESSDNSAVITVDLKSEKSIYEMSVLFHLDVKFSGYDHVNTVEKYTTYKYLLEYSLDGVNYFTYADCRELTDYSMVYYHGGFAKARYVRLTANCDINNISVTEFKIMGE